MAVNRAATLLHLSRPYRIATQRLIGQFRHRSRAHSSPPRFPIFERVDVSIIIPVLYPWQDTLECLESIARWTFEFAYEVIVVDDGASAETSEMLKRVEGVIALRSEKNPGFSESCNRGVAVARGGLLVFLDNGAVVTPGWLGGAGKDFPGDTRDRARGRQAHLSRRPAAGGGRLDLARRQRLELWQVRRS